MICEIHLFHLQFSHGVLLRSLEICLQQDTAYRVWDVFYVLLGCKLTLVFGLHTENCKNLFLNLGFPA